MTDDLVKRLRYLSRVFRQHDLEDLTYDDYLSAKLYPDEAADRIEALTAHYKVLWEANLRIGIERDALTADNARLREALEPFAAKANGYDGIPPAKYWGDTSFVMRYYDDEEVSVTLGNLRKARAALNTGKEVMPNGTSKVPNNDIGPGDQAVAGAARAALNGETT